MNELDRWTNAAIEALGLDAGHAENALVLDVARDVAHGVLRPAAPVAAYLFGVCLLYTSPSPRDRQKSRMPSSA